MIRVSPTELRRVAAEQEAQSRALTGLLADVQVQAALGTSGLHDEQAWLAVRMGSLLHVIEVLAGNHAAVARGLRRAAEVYDGVDHPRATAAAKMVM